MYGRDASKIERPDPPSVAWALFSLRGRIGRATYLLGQLFMLCVLAVVVALIVNTPEESDRFAAWGLAFIVAGAASTWSVFALSIKRLSDIGWPRALIILLFLPPTIFMFIIALAIMPGSSLENDHGPPPFG